MGRVLGRVERLGFRLWRRTPLVFRLFLIRRMTPSYHVGAMCVIERPDGALLMIRNSYRRGWGFPGGFLKRGESPGDAARRETCEEIGVEVDIDTNPKVVVDPRLRRVDVIFTGRLPPGAPITTPRPRSAEILEAQWFPAAQLPDLQPEAVTALIQLGRSQRPPTPPV